MLNDKLKSRLHAQHLDASKLTLEEMEQLGEFLAYVQRGVMWWIADLTHNASVRFPDTWNQVFPEYMSPGVVSRSVPVGRAYSPNERNIGANYTVHMQHANKSNRIQLVEESVEAGRTADEERKHKQTNQKPMKNRWLLAIDVNYYLHRFWFSGAGVEAAKGVTDWITRLVGRLKKDSGLKMDLTDVVCCFDHPLNHRKAITEGWDDKYKDRPAKDPELKHQIILVRELLEKQNLLCVSIEGMEGDDLLASYAKQFEGHTTILTQDKDCRQCLSESCSIMLDVEWHQNEISGDLMPEYKWLSHKSHLEQTGIPAEHWTDYQAIMGDNVDGIKGAIGIGEKGAADLVKEYDTVDEIIDAAKLEAELVDSGQLIEKESTLKKKKRNALIEFEAKKDATLQLVTLRTDLEIPMNTRIA